MIILSWAVVPRKANRQVVFNEEKEMDKVVFSVINPREIRISTIIFYYPIKSY